ncbi:signal peptidase I [Trichocoleus sp. FACHB-591]|uniref:signal peptidase I n=1 Tax=Trichocoleus sp. FACHB-591 TaxID=2692872 RepID=UPI0016845645|nr:signal peptidase I [Trichocoleus sp. FACHB-591]
MTENLLELAKQGNPDAIATLMNRALKPQGITAAVELVGDRLQVELVAERLPNQSVAINYVRRGLLALGVAGIQQVQVSGKQVDQAALSWMEEFAIADQASVSDTRPTTAIPAAASIASSRSLTQAGSGQKQKSAGTGEVGAIASKDAWFAANLSLLFPGLGQIYVGQIVRGLLFAGMAIALIWLAFWSIFSPAGNTLIGLSCILPVVFIYIVDLFEAYRGVTGGSILEVHKEDASQKESWLAVFLSQLLPGLGQVYLQQNLLGTVLIVAMIVAASGLVGLKIHVWLPAMITGFACYHAYAHAPKKSAIRAQQIIVLVIASIVAIRLLMGAVPASLQQRIERFVIPSSSMEPTLQVKDRIFVLKSLRYVPKDGDLVVFHPLQRSSSDRPMKDKFFVKRVIGTPGETIQVKEGRVYRNDQPLQESYISEPPAYEWGPEVVPNDAYLVLGDNRNDSFDSHVWGFLPDRNIVGRAYKIYWPPARIRPLNQQ